MAKADVEIVVYRRYSDAAQRPPWQGAWLVNGHYVDGRPYGRTEAEALQAARADLRSWGIDESAARVDERWWHRRHN